MNLNTNTNCIPLLVRIFEKVGGKSISDLDIQTAGDQFLELNDDVDLKGFYEGWGSLDSFVTGYLQEKLKEHKDKQAKLKDCFIEKASAEKPALSQKEIYKLCDLTKPTINSHAKAELFLKHDNGSIDTRSFLEWLQKYKTGAKYKLLKENWNK